MERAATDLFARLVGLDTVSSKPNLPAVELLADALDRPGIDVSVIPSPREEGKAALVARVGPPTDPEGSRPGLVLSGHMDVVPAGEAGWESDPFSLTERDDRWVGRGTADMKGFLALATAAALEAADEGGLRHPLALLFTYDEELGCLGAEDLAREHPALGRSLPEATIVGEPTSLAVVRLHKGHLKARAVVHGTSAHSGYPHLGDNAIERAARAVTELGRLRKRLESERVASSDAFPESPSPALNVGTIRGGRAINIVPDRAEIEIGVRLLPGMETGPVVESLRDAVRQAADSERGDDGWSLEVLSASPPMELAADHPLHRGMLDLTDQAGGRSVSFATDAGWLQTMGLACAVWGPGAIEVAHKPNEFMPKDEFFAARKTLGRAIDRFCRQEAT